MIGLFGLDYALILTNVLDFGVVGMGFFGIIDFRNTAITASKLDPVEAIRTGM
jgi:hypothetical protein